MKIISLKLIRDTISTSSTVARPFPERAPGRGGSSKATRCCTGYDVTAARSYTSTRDARTISTFNRKYERRVPQYTSLNVSWWYRVVQKVRATWRLQTKIITTKLY